MSSTNDSKTVLLDPPSFDLPSDYEDNPSDYELWAMRVPIDFDMSLLNGQTFPMKDLEKIQNMAETVLTSFHIDDNDDDSADGRLRVGSNENGPVYNLSLAQPNESQSFRILTSKEKGGKRSDSDSNDDESDDDDSNDDEENEKKQMIPIPVEFSRNLNLVEMTHSKVKDLDVAPSMDRAPKVNLVKEKMRIPYVKIDQKTGLKKRWNVFGSNAVKGSFFGNDGQNKMKNDNSNNAKKENNVVGLETPSRSSTSTTHTPESSSSKTRKVSDDIVDDDNNSNGDGREKKRKKSKKDKSAKKSKRAKPKA